MKKFYEKDLEEIIFNATESQLDKRGFEVYGKKFRQINISGYGRADLIFVEKMCFDYPPFVGYLRINIIELKEDKIGISAFLQAVGYANGIVSYMNKRGYDNYTISITLVGSELDKSGTFCFLPDLFYTSITDEYNYGRVSSIQFYTYKYDIDGISFQQEYGYCSNI